MLRPRIGIGATPEHHDGKDMQVVKSAFVDAVVSAGGLAVMLPVLDAASAPELLAVVDGLLLTGGGDVDPACYGGEDRPAVYGVDRARDDSEMALARAAVDARLPVLGVCRGSQVVNVAFGGTLVAHLPDLTVQDHRVPDRTHELVHDVAVLDGSLLAAVFGGGRQGVNTLHHQAVAEVGDGLVCSAWAGDGTVEGLEDPDRRILTVQWHPELLVDHPNHLALFGWLVDEAAEGPQIGYASDRSEVA